MNFWRHERLSVPLAYLDNDELFGRLGQALTLAEATAAGLTASVWLLAKLLEAPGSDDPDSPQPKREVIREQVRRLAPTRAYWPGLEAPFRGLLIDLAADEGCDADGVVSYGARTLPAWAKTLHAAARAAFHQATNGLDTSGRALKALAVAERDFGRRVNDTLGPYLRTPEGGDE